MTTALSLRCEHNTQALQYVSRSTIACGRLHLGNVLHATRSIQCRMWAEGIAKVLLLLHHMSSSDPQLMFSRALCSPGRGEGRRQASVVCHAGRRLPGKKVFCGADAATAAAVLPARAAVAV